MKITVRIEGVTPLICNKFTDEAAQKSSNGKSAVYGGNRGTPYEIAESKLYLDAKGNPCIPQPNLLRCIVDGGSFHKAGKKQITTKESSILYACLDVSGVTIPIEHKEPWRVDTRPVVIPSTKGRILCHRPMFDDWALDFELELDDTMLDVKFLRVIVDDAGKRIGLGDFRPSRKGPYGKFAVTKWAVQEQQLLEAAE